MKILITGSSGMIGSALISFLTAGKHQVYKMVRTRADLLPHEIAWDPEQGIINPELLEDFDAVVNLAGESIMGRWAPLKKERIRYSRVNSTVLLSQALSQLRKPPSVFVSASAIGYYGNRGDELLTEKSLKGRGFMADVCQEWEESTQLAIDKGIRTINLRIGLVLSPKGGALKQMLLPFKLCLGGQLGSGRQYMSWITLDDLVGAIYYAICQPSIAGPVNAVSPYCVTNADFTKVLGEVLHRPTFFNMPEYAVNLIFGDMGRELLLSSERVKPEKLEQAGFVYSYPQLEGALHHLLKK